MCITVFSAYADCEDAYQRGHTIDGIYMINPDNHADCIPHVLQHEC